MAENQCAGSDRQDTPVSKNIKNLFITQRDRNPQLYFSPPGILYDFEHPMVVSVPIMEQKYNNLKDSPTLSNAVGAYDLFNLFTGSRRYEDQKCSFRYLSEQRKNDIRPYLKIAHQCYKKYSNEKCDDSEYTNMTSEEEKSVKETTLQLCKSFTKDATCLVEYGVNKQKNTLGTMISKYYNRFANERFTQLFKLRPTHLKYQCQKSADKVVMNIKVLEGSFDHEFLSEVLSYVEQTWTSPTFSLKFELTKAYSSDAITIIPTERGTSFVPNDNNRIVYLSTAIDMNTQKHVLAHEFGHVLGFPDCYIEFFDDTKKELVYYEISKNNTNIMCSLKNDVRVPDDYFTQLSENSCVFN